MQFSLSMPQLSWQVPLAIRGEKRYWPYKKTGATKKKQAQNFSSETADTPVDPCQVRKHDLKRNNKEGVDAYDCYLFLLLLELLIGLI